MRAKTVSRISAIALASAMAACSGGGAPPVAPFAQMQPSQQQTQNVAFRIVVPSATTSATQRRPAYVSAATASASIAVNAGTPVVVSCTTTCSGSVSAPIGSDTFAVQLFDAHSNLLSTGSTTQTIVPGTANSVNLTFNGVVASLSIALSAGITSGTATSVGVTVNALDADGNTIVAPGAFVDNQGNPLTVTLTDSDTSGATSLSTTSLTGPTTGIMLNYTGVSLSAAPTIGAVAPHLASVDAPVALAIPGPVVLSPDSLSFTDVGSAFEQGVTLSQTSSSNIFGAVASACTGIATISPSAGRVFEITPVANGTCVMYFVGADGDQGQLNITVNTCTINDVSRRTPAGWGC